MKSLFVNSLLLGAVSAFPAADLLDQRSSLTTLSLRDVTKIDFQSGRSDRKGFGTLRKSFPDPSLIQSGHSWVAYATSSNNKRIPVATSDDAHNWNLTSHEALPKLPDWVGDGGIWAPDVQKNDAGDFVMYFSGKHKDGKRCIGVASSNDALGPFKATNKALICDNEGGGVIDPAGYYDGKDRWIVWKVDGNGLGGASSCNGGNHKGEYKPTPIRIQKLKGDGMTLEGEAKTILNNDGKADDGIVEAPTLYKTPGGRFIIFFSTHCYVGDDYNIKYAFSDKIDGTYKDRGVLLKSSKDLGIYGPGGLDIDPNGVDVVFHGRAASKSEGKKDNPRFMYSAKLAIKDKK